MLHATANDESIPGSSVKRVSLTRDPDMTVHDIYNLIVRMVVHRSNPAFHHLVFGKKQFVVVGKHTAFQPTFRRGLLAFLVRYHYEVGESVCSRFHLLFSYQPRLLSSPRLFVVSPEKRFP
jgi:hypothetical protein